MNHATLPSAATAVDTYQRALLTAVNQPDGLEIVEAPLPEPQAGEVRIRIQASGVAFADIMCRQGVYPFMPSLPFTPGYDLVGVVDKMGADVAELTPGQLVGALLPKFGANADYVCIPANWAVPLPEGIVPETAVALILNYLTAYRILHDKVQAQPGERVLVHSAAGGVGTAVLQLGQTMGLKLYGTASKHKHDLVTGLGGTPIDYRHEDFAARIRQLTGEGIDIVCDPIGGETMIKSYQLLRRGGRLVNYGMFGTLRNAKAGVVQNLARLVWYNIRPDGKKAIFYGSTNNMVNGNNSWYRKSLTHLFTLLADGRINPIIGAALPLSNIAQAQHLLETGSIQGKVVLIH